MTETNERQLRRVLRSMESEEKDLTRKLSAIKESRTAIEKVLSAINARPSISEEKLNQVESYLIAHPKATQVQIAKATKLNSGTVSVAVSRLEEEGKARRVAKEGRSQAWEYAQAA